MYSQYVWAWIVTAAAAYIIGSVSGAIILSRTLFNSDIRSHGSGNAGMTNILRTFGKKTAMLTAVMDFTKMILALLLARYLLGTVYGTMVGGACAALGHAFPIFYRFKGGKCVMSAAALLLMLDWRIFAVVIGVFALLIIITRTVAVGSIAAAASAPLVTWLFVGREEPRYVVFILCMACFIIWLHRSNIKRLLSGQEEKTVAHKEGRK